MAWINVFSRNPGANMSKKELEVEISKLEALLNDGKITEKQRTKLKSLKIELGHRKYNSPRVRIVRG